MPNIIRIIIKLFTWKVPNLLSVRFTLLTPFLLLTLPYMASGESTMSAGRSADASVPYLTTTQSLTLVSANDGRTLVQRDSRGLFDKTRVPAQDSLRSCLGKVF